VDSEKWKYVDKNGFAESRADQTGWSQVFAPPRSDGPGNFNKHEQNGGRLFSVSKLILEATLYPEAAMDWAEQVRGSTAIAVALMHGAATRNCSALPYPTLVLQYCVNCVAPMVGCGAAAVASPLAAVLTEIYLCGVCSCQKD
jgi:hypothetical protein